MITGEPSFIKNISSMVQLQDGGEFGLHHNMPNGTTRRRPVPPFHPLSHSLIRSLSPSLRPSLFQVPDGSPDYRVIIKGPKSPSQKLKEKVQTKKAQKSI